MELQQTTGKGPQIRSYQSDEFVVDDQTYRSSILVLAEQTVETWRPRTIDDLQLVDIEALVDYQPELILLGTGSDQHFPPEVLLAPCYQARIGIEIMTTTAACRTYNLLMAEGRQVLAALCIG